jgi:hypothetical protein
MFWKKEKHELTVKNDKHSHPYRFCYLYISEKYKQILFVPYSKQEIGIYKELDNLIIDTWPCKFQDLQTNIEKVLNSFSQLPTNVKATWPSFENSKEFAKVF